MEYRLKSVRYGNKIISCIPPKRYGERFKGFMKVIFEEGNHKERQEFMKKMYMNEEEEEEKE